MTDQDTLEQLGHQLFKGKAVNIEAWKLDDKVWVKERKESWNNLKKHISDLGTGLTKTQLKTLERYYLEGKVPRFNPETLVSVNLFFMCWLHPDQSEPNWQLMKDVIWLIGGEYAKEHYRQSIVYVLMGGSCVFSEDYGFKNGFLGGLEERVFNFLLMMMYQILM